MITHMQVNVKKLHENAVLPTYGSTNAAGADLYACIDAPLTIAPHETVMVHTGLAMEIPEGYAGLVYARSGLAAKRQHCPISNPYSWRCIISFGNRTFQFDPDRKDRRKSRI